MKFCSFSARGIKRFGIAVDEAGFLDLKIATEILDLSGDLDLPELKGVRCLKDWLGFGEAALDISRSTFDLINIDRERFVSALFTKSDIRMLAPIESPGKIIAVGLNYRDHAEEQNVDIPDHPRIFAKFSSAVIGPEEPIKIPEISEKVDPEAELCMVVISGGKNISRAQARNSVAFMTGNDVSARDLQYADKQWVRGKSCDTFAPCGPFVTTLDEIGDPHNLSIELRRNGEIKQSSHTSRMIFDCWELVKFISKTSTLYPGDIIFTGTPGGVGVFRNPPEFLEPGDVVEVSIEKLGTLRNPVVRA